jgi:hypothetical protein
MKTRSPTRDDDIPLIPQKIPEDSVESVGGARDENNFFEPSAEKLGQAMSGRIEVFRKMQFEESIDISLYGAESSLSGSKHWVRHGAVGT